MNALATALRTLPFFLAATTLLSGCRDSGLPAPMSEARSGAAPSNGNPPGASSTTPELVQLTDMSGSLEAIRADFNAHKHQNRFLTLLAPT